MATDSLTVPTGGSAMRRRSSNYNRIVMCAVDLSDCSKDAFYWYLANVWRAEDLIILCHCPEPAAMPSFSFKSGLSLPTDKWQEIMTETCKKTQELETFYEQACIEKKLRYKVRGESNKNVGEGICRVAEEEKVNLIVMGTRGLGAVKRALIGSVSEFVTRNTSVPCLIVPATKSN